MNGKCEENEQFEVAPHPAFSHLLPEGEGKEPTGCFLLKRSNLQIKSMTQNPRPFWERGDHVSGGLGNFVNGKARKMSSLK